MSQQGTWPFPGESPVARARRVALAYRAAVEAHAPEQVLHDLDRIIAREWGEAWAAPRVLIHGPDDALSAAEAGALICISAAAINNLRRAGRLTGHKDPAGHWRYRAREVSRLSSEVRRRSARATDTLSDDTRSPSS